MREYGIGVGGVWGAGIRDSGIRAVEFLEFPKDFPGILQIFPGILLIFPGNLRISLGKPGFS